MRLQLRIAATAIATAIATLCCTAQAQSVDPLKAAVEKAVTSNPEVTARFNAYLAASDAVGVARSAYFPKLDLSASVGRDSDKITSRNPQAQSLTRTGLGLGLTQLLWDGLGTQREVERVGHDRLTRYFELLDVTEQTALEAARAYFDVLRYRRLVQLAEDNYVQHRYASQRIQSKFSAGVGSGVDLEQANARLALAESNLTTEVANLHDVSSRYLRIVGETPPKGAQPIALLDKGLPGSIDDVLATAVRQSPSVSASIEGLRAARSAADGRQAAFQPRVEARARTGGGKNFDGIVDQKRDSAVELVLNWNLFNGGGDLARVRQQANIVNQAADLRDKACRDTRQTAAIAYNDIRKLNDQLAQLDRNTLAISKARDAYLQQFDIGKRSLLDLLNAENELYTARRAYANAEYDRALAYARTQAGMTQLTSQLGIARVDTQAGDAAGWSAGNDAPVRCPVVAMTASTVDFNALAQRVPGAVVEPAAPAPPARTAATAPLPVAKPAPVMTAEVPGKRLNDWAAAWEAKDADRYLGFYAPTFMPAKGGLDAWKANRRKLVTKPGPITVLVSNVKTTSLGADAAETRFTQNYSSATFKDATTKVLTWARKDGQWYIVKESNR